MRAKCAPFTSASPPPPAGLRTETWTARRRPDGDDAPGRRAIRLSRERDVRGALRSSFSDSEGERACVRACFVFFSARDGNPHGHTYNTQTRRHYSSAEYAYLCILGHGHVRKSADDRFQCVLCMCVCICAAVSSSCRRVTKAQRAQRCASLVC